MGMYGDGITINTPGAAYVGGQHITIANNYVDCSNSSGSSSSGFGIDIAGGYFITVQGNVLYNCRNQGIHIEQIEAHQHRGQYRRHDR